MKTNKILALGFCILLGGFLFYQVFPSEQVIPWDTPADKVISRFEQKHIKTPNERYKALEQLIYRENGENYGPGYQQKELRRLLASQSESNFLRTTPLVFQERGPSNVPGRARGLIVLPQDETHKTWLVGSSGGGIWKTTDGGTNWVDKSIDFPNLAVTSLGYSESNPSIIYAGTGEYVASAYTSINGDGIFKSLDAGETWEHLGSTAANDLWESVTRIIVDPSDPNIVLASTAPNRWGAFTSNIMKSTDGGASWRSVFVASGGAIEQLVAAPDDFNRMYAGQRFVGVLISEDAGETWSRTEGILPSGRVELAISPVDPARMYVSAVGEQDANQEADIYYSLDSGRNWTLIIDPSNRIDVLGGQGWYDNTILAHPFNIDEFYIGGIGIYKYVVNFDVPVKESAPGFRGIDLGGTEAFMTRVNFTASLDGGTLEKGSAAESEFTTVEIRFGPGETQKAHRYLVPDGRGSGVADNEYSYADYVDVPFEVWDVDADPPRQLMAAFRDQQRDGVFNLLNNNTEGGANDSGNNHSREYLYVNSRDYDAENPSPEMAITGGHVSEDLYFIWPYLIDGATWDPDNLPESTFKIKWGTTRAGEFNVSSNADPYGRFGGINPQVHPDHHNLISIIHDENAKTWQIVNVNDGGAYVSDVSEDPGSVNNTWKFAGSNMNTTQFYGADKAPGVDQYVGGAQDNGSFVSMASVSADETTPWDERWGGDGFDAVWHPTDRRYVLVTSQNLNMARSANSGSSFTSTGTNVAADANVPFIGQFANTVQNPDLVYTATGTGVYVSKDFGLRWTLVNLSSNDDWLANVSLVNVEISDACPEIVWAGSAVSGEVASLFLSTDRGSTFSSVPDNGLNTGLITGIGSSYKDAAVVYVLFSYANSPKILKSSDYGQTWSDISGFSDESTSTGFPDVAVRDIIEMPNDPNTLWAGTEIGIVETNDGGATWHLLDGNLPHVSIWDFELADDQIVIATHGRGVWSYTLPELPELAYYPIIDSAYIDDNNANLALYYTNVSDMDSTRIFINTIYHSTITGGSKGQVEQIIPFPTEKDVSVYLVGYRNNGPFPSNIAQAIVPKVIVLAIDADRDLRVYPNPTSDFVQIEGLARSESIKVFDINGAQMKAQYGDQGLDLRSVKSGVYFIHFRDEDGKLNVTKVVKR
ncbi:MAG: photosystem II stability/assembly factor-like uncharacterized protein [Marinoscillum sp.]|jgi:photosystem II stability/assembly factor-like uncharacterized protein